MTDTSGPGPDVSVGAAAPSQFQRQARAPPV